MIIDACVQTGDGHVISITSISLYSKSSNVSSSWTIKSTRGLKYEVGTSLTTWGNATVVATIEWVDSNEEFI